MGLDAVAGLTNGRLIGAHHHMSRKSCIHFSGAVYQVILER